MTLTKYEIHCVVMAIESEIDQANIDLMRETVADCMESQLSRISALRSASDKLIEMGKEIRNEF